MIWRRTFLSLILLTAVVMSACAAPAAPAAAPATDQTAAPSEPVRGGAVVVGTPQEPGVLNPLLASSSIEDAISSLTIEGLVQVDDQGNYVPVLAEALPTISEDGLLATYKLKPDIKFSNGDPFTCADVQFTVEAILSDLSGASTSGYNRIDAVECPDDLTVEVYFSEVYAPYLRLFSYIIPRGAGDLTALDAWDFNRNPIGTGAWIVKEWVAGDYIEFMPNPNYREAGKPYLDSLIVKILPSREVGMQLLGSGEIKALWDITEADFPALESMAAQGVSYAGAQTGENELLLFNFADPAVDAPADASANPHPILNDVRVREAIQLAIDKQEIVDTLLYGNVNVGTTVIPNGTFACPQPPSEFNVEKANALLDTAGWTLGADGIREKDGVKMELKITTTSGNLLREQTEQVLVEMLKAIGLNLIIENVPSDVLFAGWDSNGMRKHGQFDILLYTTGPFLDPDSHLYQNYHSNNIPTAENEGAGSNYSRYVNADVDAWIDEAASITDVEQRRALYCQVAAQINQDLPRVFLYERLLLSGYRTELQNFKVSPGPSDFTWGAADWWLAQ
ncbi:MAG TPA: ABC transporter substrate-binding protein [Chloroflexi bacterium]|nr:ABC transporter substrate-binding protein [Chloroflexota bacterium]HHW86928.1 peptide ABC transporter substrate-binding protein [Chloroflexota bacterium]